MSNSTTKYFSGTVSIRCEKCEVIVHHSEPRKCKDSSNSEGNIMHVYHSLCEGYGRAELSRLSAAMGANEISTSTFSKIADFIYREMYSFYDEQQCVTKSCVQKLNETEGT